MSGSGQLQDALTSGLGASRRIGVAVSGGSDSLALLHLLHARNDVQLVAATVDHGLRPEARAEADHVAAICLGLGVPHQRLGWTGWDGTGNLQDQARRARYRLLAEWGRVQAVDAVAVGHTMDDQAETFLMRLARQAGVEGLAQMAVAFRRDGALFLRPLLGCRREDLRAFLRSKGVEWVEDASNDDVSFDRVRMRKALTLLEPLGIDAPGLSRVAGHMASARLALEARAAEIAGRIARVEAGDVVFDRAALMALSFEDFRRLLVGALRLVSSAGYAARAEPIQKLQVQIAAGENATLQGCRVMVHASELRVTRELQAVAGLRVPSEALWDGRWQMKGPHRPGLHIAALGEVGLTGCKGWRDTGLSRETLVVSPAIWSENTLISAPIAGFANGWRAELAYSRDDYAESLLSH